MNSLKMFMTINLRNQWNYNISKSKRLFYSPSSLGINSFIARRENVQKNSKFNLNVYKKRMKEACAAENTNILVFSNDILKMTYLTENSEDLDVIHKLIKKLMSQNFIRAHHYSFGPEVMRLHHIMNKPLEALALVENELLYSEFDSSASFTLLLDLLFENSFYEELIKMYDYKISRSELNFNAYLHLIYFAACYKLNTRDSFEKALKLWQNLANIGYKPGKRISLYFAALSLAQNQIFCAMEVLPLHKFETLSENIKCLILAKAKRFSDAFETLRVVLSNENEKFFVLKEIICAIEKEIYESTEENIVQFQYIKEDLYNKNKINDDTLDKHLSANLNFNFKKQEKLSAEN